MIRGLEHFKSFFKKHSDNFILVGGVATYLLLEQAGATKVRATKDLDIVLIMKPSADFLNAIKEYIKNGGYEIQRGINDRVTFYRFQKPTNKEFPIMIELFATIESDFKLFDNQHVVPVAVEDGVKSLSAILLDEEYYSIIRKNAVEKDGLTILNEIGLIPFKAKAYLEIKARGEDSKNWKKHRADIINLTVNFLTEESREELTGKVRDQFVEFMGHLKNELTPDVVQGASDQKVSVNEIVELLEKTFL